MQRLLVNKLTTRALSKHPPQLNELDHNHYLTNYGIVLAKLGIGIDEVVTLKLKADEHQNEQ